MDAKTIRERLEEGNRSFAASRAGEPDYGRAPAQRPVAAVLGCADARAPAELIFQRSVNDLFVVRVAGNVLAAEQLGSLAYAAANLGERLRLVVVLGHSGCGAVGAAVDAFLDPKNYPMGRFGLPIRSIIDPLLVSVQIAARALGRVGADSATPAAYRAALIETSVAVNAGSNATTLQQELTQRVPLELEVVFGVYDLATGKVGVPGCGPAGAIGLLDPPADRASLDELADGVAASSYVANLLRG